MIYEFIPLIISGLNIHYGWVCMEAKFSRITPLATFGNLADRSVSLIVEMISNGDFKRGEKLPPQEELAKRLGISRTALREALKELSYRGLIDTRHGTGTFICENFVEIKEILEARRILEPQIAFLAAQRADKSELDFLAALADKMAKSAKAGDFAEFSSMDLQFHCAISEMAKNRALIRLFSSVKDMMLLQQNLVQRLPGAMSRAHNYHVDIVAAFLAGKAKIASQTMAKHLDDVCSALDNVDLEGNNKVRG